jgi:hypothetical protein
MKNEDGAISIIITLSMLVLMTILATAGLKTSIVELKIATNELIYQKCFYAAEAGINWAPDWIKTNLDESDFKNVNWLGKFDMDIDTDTNFYAEVQHQTDIDPSDSIEKVLLYGDTNGDFLNEINFTTGVPLEIVTSEGTHARSGRSRIRATYIFEPLFMMPDAALHVNESVNGNGVSGQIIGEGPEGYKCDPIADISYEIAGGTIEYGGSLGKDTAILPSKGTYPFPLILEVINNKSAVQKILGSNNVKGISTTKEQPGVVLLIGNSKVTNLTGFGILFVDGDFEAAGNLDWHGLILVDGDLVLSGGGSKIIYGAVIVQGDALAISGSVDIIYDCDELKNLFNNFSRYKITSWTDMID